MDLFFSWFWDSQLEPMTPTVGANEGSVSTVWSAEGKRPEFVSAKRASSAPQAREATIERTGLRIPPAPHKLSTCILAGAITIVILFWTKRTVSPSIQKNIHLMIFHGRPPRWNCILHPQTVVSYPPCSPARQPALSAKSRKFAPWFQTV